MSEFERAYQEVSELVREFDQHRDQYVSSKYQESQVRTDFIDKFFSALGWDVRHIAQTNPREQEVQIENNSDSLSNRKVDYAFFLAPDFQRPVFLVEAKKPSVILKSRDFYFQTVRYGFMRGTTVTVLTDFKELHILDCRRKPQNVDNIIPETQLKTFSYVDYLDKQKFGYLYWLFSREAVSTGKLKEYWKALPKPKGKARQLKLIGDTLQPPDDIFLEDLDEYRKILASEFKKANPESTGEELTEAAQKTLDRLVFLRFLEDKMIEPDFIVDKFGVKGSAWRRFISASERFDKKYNGIVFKKHFIDGTNFVAPNDDKFYQICEDFNHQNSPYLFSYIPVEILGSIYERFLGKVVVANRRGITIEKKPEVQKAGGVYYTPRYVVDYLVSNTVGKVLAGKTPKDIEKLKFADIACGSGSFLIAIFGSILQYLEDWYNNHPNDAKKDKCRAIGASKWTLSLTQKRNILVQNIYGVDIDSQAVEVAQLSLFLKLLEAESISTTQDSFFRDHTILPDLSNNIVCGNSLVDFDIADLFPLSSDKELQVKPFSFRSSFNNIMTNGGFDAIVGNPPYVRIQVMKELRPEEVKYLSKKYKTAAKGNYDMYVVFVEKAIELLKQKGLFGYILPSKFFTTDYGGNLRSMILRDGLLNEIVDFKFGQVFQNATTYTCLLMLSKMDNTVFNYSVVSPPSSLTDNFGKALHPLKNLESASWTFGSEEEETINNKLQNESVSLLDLPASMSRGSSSGADEVFILGYQNNSLVDSDNNIVEIEEELLRTPLFATDFTRYLFNPKIKQQIIFPYRVINGIFELYTESEIKSKYPKAHRYLTSKKSILEHRAQFNKWFGYSAPRNLSLHDKADMIVPLLANHGLYSILPEEMNKYCVMASAGFSVSLDPSCKLSPMYVIALLNSKLLFWRLSSISNKFRGGWITCTKQYVGTLPIKNLDLSKVSQKKQHDDIVSLVTQILDAKKRLGSAKREADKEQIDRKCQYLELEIDKYVYSLYGLTEDEILIVQGS